MSSRVVSDTQARAEDEILYIRYNTDANVVNIACDPNACKRSYSSKILKIVDDFGLENRTKSLCKSGGLSHIQPPSWHWFFGLSFVNY